MDQILINHLRQLYLEDPSGFHPTALWKLFHMYDQGTYEIHMEAGSIHKLEVTCNKQLVVYYDTHREAFQRDPMAYDLVLLNQVYTDGSRKFGHVRPYFKLTHTLTTIEAPRPISGYYSRAVKVEEELKMVRDFINACYTDIQVTEEMVEAWTQEPVYHGALWQWVIDESNHKPVGLGIGTYDPTIGEGALEWIQVLPEMRGKGLGQLVVKTLLMTLKTMADFVTVSGALDSPYKPYKLYETCGFSHMATWYIVRPYVFESERLGFRRWLAKDCEPFARMNASKAVMRYFTKTLTRQASDGFIDRIEAHFEEKGYGLWAVEIKKTRTFIGFIGFYTAHFEADFTPCVEIGWRLDQAFWGHGYATEGAKRCLQYADEVLPIEEVFSFTSVINRPSRHVMEKIGLQPVSTFDHPNIEADNPLCPHVLYKKALDRG